MDVSAVSNISSALKRQTLTVKKIRELFYDASRVGVQPVTVFVLVSLQLASSAFEFLGIASFVPIFQFLNSHGDATKLASESNFWRELLTLSDRSGLTITLPNLLLTTFAILIGRQVFTFFCEYYQFNKREMCMAHLRAKLFAAFLRAASDAQDRASGGGMVVDMTTNTLRAAQHLFSRFALVTHAVIFLVYFVGMMIMNSGVTILIFGIIGFSVLVVAPLIFRARKLGREFVKINRTSSDFVVERLRLARLVRLSRKERLEASAINRLSFQQSAVSVRMWRTLGVVDVLLETIAITAALIFVYMATTIFGLDVGVVGLMIALLLRLVPIVRQLARTKQSADGTRASFDSVARRLEELVASREVYGVGREMCRFDDCIELVGVSYSYANRKSATALGDVSFKIPKGKTTAIVGPSGAGKSTLVDLLPRLRDPDRGQVLFDGVDAKMIELGSLRKSIAYVSQTPMIADAALSEHICYGVETCSIEDMRRAARLSGALSFIESFPQGFDTRAGEGGKALSGGQRQRLDLARGLVSNAPILILDEPTTGLDIEAVKHFNAALQRIRRETTVTIIIVTHDLSSISDADQIVVLNSGRIEGIGSHAELISGGSWYAQAVGNPVLAK